MLRWRKKKEEKRHVRLHAGLDTGIKKFCNKDKLTIVLMC